MRRIRHLLLLVGLLTSAAANLAGADMVVELRDGRRLVLPVERDQVERIRFTDDRELSQGRIRLLPPVGEAAGMGDPPASDASAVRVLRVSPTGPLRLPSEAAARARDGDVVEIAPGRYRDVAVWRASDLVIRGVGGRPVVDAGGRGAEGKAVWVVKGARVRIERVELTGARVADRNGAGIRAEGADLELVDVVIRDNEMGILVAADFRGTVTIRNAAFYRNGTDHERYGVPPGHQIYVSGGDRLVLEGSYIHTLRGGHGVKSRARANVIRCNRIEDGAGAGSYLIDIAEAAPTRIEGNLLIQGRRAENRTLIAFGAEGGDPRASLLVAWNTLVNEASDGVFVANHTPTQARLVADLLVGRGRVLAGPGTREAVLAFPNREAAGLGDDGRPLARSPVVDAGAGVGLPPPPCRFAPPRGTAPRGRRGRAPDVGAFEGG